MDNSDEAKLSKRWRVVFMMILSIIVQLFSGMPVLAENVQNEFEFYGMQIKMEQICLTEDEEGGNPIAIGDSENHQIDIEKDYNIFYKFLLSDCSELTTTDQSLKLSIPKEFKIGGKDFDIEVRVTNEEGVESRFIGANCTANLSDNSISVKFTEDIKAYSEVWMYFYMGASMDSEAIEEKDGNTYEFMAEVSTDARYTYSKDIFIKPTEKVPPTITKAQGVLDEAINEVSWLITVTGGSEILENVNIVDSFDSTYQNFSRAYLGPNELGASEYESSPGKFIYSIAKLEAGEQVVLTVVTKLTDEVFTSVTEDDKWVTVKNTADLQNTASESLVENIAEANCTVSVNWISKTGKQSGSNIKEIDWKVTINNNHQDLNGYVFEDYIPRGLKLEGDIMIQVAGDDSSKMELSAFGMGNYSLVDEESSTIVNGATAYSNQKIRYEFTSTTSASYVISYTTKVENGKEENETDWTTNDMTTYYNVAGIGPGVAKYKDFMGVGITSTMIRKSGSYDPATGRITWRITINENKNEVVNPIVTDRFVDENTGNATKIDDKIQTLIPDSVKIKKVGESEVAIAPGESLTEIQSDLQARYQYSEEEKQIVFEFDGTINEAYTITFQTQVENPNHYAVNHKASDTIYNNKATFYGNSSDGVDYPITEVNASTAVTSEVIAKEGKSYDYNTREAVWYITINQNKMKIPYDADNKLVVTEIIQQGQIFKSMKVYKGAVADANLIGTISEPDVSYTFKEEITDSYILVVTTQLTEEKANEMFKENKQQKIKNTASISGSVIPKVQEVTESININNSLVQKWGSQQMDQPITWSIVVNPNRMRIEDPIISDNLVPGLEIDPESIKLYKMNVDSQTGNVLGNKEEVDISKEDYIIEQDENSGGKYYHFTFRIPNESGVNDTNNGGNAAVRIIKECYKLEFNTDVVNVTTNKASITNTASFSGKGMKEATLNTESRVEVNFQSAGGGASIYKGKITVIKKDQVTGEKLSGVEFELYKNGKATGKKVVTGTNGEASFEKLKISSSITYQLLETKGPEGYVKEDGLIDLKSPLTDGIPIQIIEVTNKSIGYPISFTKVGEEDELLEGAQFTLYTKSDYEGNTLKNGISASSKANGTVSFSSVIAGEYVLQETEAPEGYVLPTKTYNISVAKNGNYAIAGVDDNKISNKRIKGNIEVTKQDDKGNALAGATFALYKAPYNQGDEALELSNKTGVDGKVIFSNYPYGKYVIYEKSAPDQYVISSQAFEVAIAENDKTYPVQVTNELRGDYVIQVKKVDTQGNPLAGAKFVLIDAVGNRSEIVSSAIDTGLAIFNNVAYGTYTVEEVEAPKYYVLGSETKKQVTIMPSVKEAIVTFSNDLGRDGQIQITKVNKKNKTLQGAVFTLYDSEGKQVINATSDINGLATFESIIYGQYTIKETKSPSGYTLSKEVITVEITSSEVCTFTVINEAESSGSDNDNDNGDPSGGDHTTQPHPTETPKPVETPKPTEEIKDDNLPGKEQGDSTIVIINPEVDEKVPQGGLNEQNPLATDTNEEKMHATNDEKSTETHKLPKTGADRNTGVLAITGLAFIIMGGSYEFYRRIKNMSNH